MTVNEISLAACLDWGRNHSDASVRQDAKWLAYLCAWRDLTEAHLNQMPCSVAVYLAAIAPKFNKRNAALLRDLDGCFEIKTYKQYQRGGRRLIERFTGAKDEAAERSARQDDWAEFLRLVKAYVRGGLINSSSARGFSKLADYARKLDINLQELTSNDETRLHEVALHPEDWRTVANAVNRIDDLRIFSQFVELLPPVPIGKFRSSWRRRFLIPPRVSGMIESWVETAARTQIDDHRHRQYAEPLSAAARNRFRAALRNFAHTAQETGLVSLSGLADLSELFHDAVVEATLGRWGQMIGEPGGLSRRSASDYVRDLCLLLDRNGLAGPAENLRGRRNYHPDLRRGKEEGKMMSPKTQSWCRKLLSDPRRSSLFETQHIEYWRIAREALEAAREAKLDLRMLANPDRMAELPLKSRSLANHLLRRARMFGTLAAFSAIELEGAPFRKSNVLDFTMRGKRTRFFDHSTATSPHFEIIVPNDELKNGHFLTRRQQEIPPIQIEDVVETDHGFRILRWFLDEIRPLFPNAENSDYLFLALKKGKPRLATGTFDDWLRVCSSEIGIPLTAHNFRHGYVSIQYNEDPSCLEDLAAVLGDTASTLRRHYAFIDRVRQRRAVQESIRERRMKRNAACRPIPAARSK